MEKQCPICGRPARNNVATYCEYGCAKLSARARMVDNHEEREQRVQAIKAAWQNGAFRCHYTGVELNIQDSSSPFYLTFDHVVPRSPSEIVVCAAAINDVKSDCTEEEFKYNTAALFEHFKDGRPLCQSDFRFSHYKRHRQSLRE